MQSLPQVYIRAALVIGAAILCIVGTAAAEAPGRLATVQSGTVSGDLHIAAHQPVPWGSQPASGVSSREFTQPFALPASAAGANVAWARLYVSVYAGSASADWPLTTTVAFDGNGDGTYETALGTETMQGAGYSTDGTVHVLNDNCTRVYSDYLAWYDVTTAIASTTPSARVNTSQIGTESFDGRLKLLALVVAYNDGDADQVRYWVNQGHAWVDAATAPTTTAFETSGVPAGFASARLGTLALSSRDGSYTFNGGALAGANPVAPVNFLECNAWDVTSSVTAGTGSTLSMGPGTGASSFKAVLAALAVRTPAPAAAPDLAITAIAPNPGAGTVLFANETNAIAVNVTNLGTAAAPASTLSVEAGGTVLTADVGPLEAGAAATVTVSDPSLRADGAVIAVTATADSTSAVDEGDEANNALSTDLAVYNNGYKGARWTGGPDLVTRAGPFEGTVDVRCSAGNSTYAAAGWTARTCAWSAADLPLSPNATVASARLYQAYAYNKKGSDPAWTLSFNGDTAEPVATYRDTKGFGAYDYPYGLYVYDVTGSFDPAENAMTVTPEAGNAYALYGACLVVVYADPAGTTERTIWVNEGFDMLQSQAQYSVSSEEATAFATFDGVNATGVTGARAIAVLASANDNGKSRFFFNAQEYPGFWTEYLSGPQVGFPTYDVTAALAGGANTARLQSFDPGSKGDNMYAMGTVLVLERAGTAPVIQLPGGAGVPTDTDADGLYDDVNGNGRKDFADVVLFFNQMTWIAANEPVAAFDYNGNGRIDFADVVWLFNHL